MMGNLGGLANHQGNKALAKSARVFPERHRWEEKTNPECEWHYFMG